MTETKVVRWFCYAGFAICSVVLVIALSFNARWFPAAVGVVIWGVPAVLMYRAEQARQEQVDNVREHLAANAKQGQGKQRFDWGDGEKS